VTSVLILGAGPAGLAAARAARRQGAEVTLVDSSDQLGGQYWRHLPASRPAGRESVLHHGWSTFQELARTLEGDDGCRILLSASVWAIEQVDGSPGRVHVVVGEPDGADREQLVFEPDALVLANGAYDRTLPFPGWTLPGVFTAGAAQALAKGERVGIGQRVVVAGAGPFLLPVAASLAATGATVVGVFEAGRVGSLVSGWLPKPWQLLRSTHKAGELGGYILGHLRHRIPYRPGTAVVRATGVERVESVTIASLDRQWRPIPGSERTIEADAVCVGHGFSPRLELAVAAGCALTVDRFVEVDDSQLTSVSGVYAAGELTGIGGVDEAMAEGQLAGHCAAGGSAADATVARARRQRERARSFAARIGAAHDIGGEWQDWLTADTVICRCEDVSYGELCATIEATSGASLRSIKLASRAGLGICQGRTCGLTLEQLLAKLAPATPREGDASTDQRPIALPIRLGELAASEAASESTNQSTDQQQGIS
jgi:NADPH-dependent 2,4-dienoyl-CoA reductase/sulfur reductase-like enzyme